MALSKNLFECQEKVANTLTELCKDMDPCLLENLIVGINMEITRAYQLGGKDTIKDMV